jgi:3-dehydroquinate dehydratase II
VKPIFVLNGPNLNLLGKREPEIYGSATLADLQAAIGTLAGELGLHVDCRQSNHEGQLVDWLHEAREAAAAVIINAGAYTHTSIALRDAVLALAVPVIEVHLSNIYARDEFRKHSYLSGVVHGIIAGFGVQSYLLAVRAAQALVSDSKC